jgi:hypothetical protein
MMQEGTTTAHKAPKPLPKLKDDLRPEPKQGKIRQE